MTRWQPPIHALTHIDATVRFPAAHEHQTSSLAVHGRSTTKRASLWTYQEYFDPEVAREKGYHLSDALAHIVLVCHQDRPNTLDRLRFGLQGGLAYTQDPLWPE